MIPASELQQSRQGNPTPRGGANEKPPAGTTEGPSLTGFRAYCSEDRSGIDHGSLGAGCIGVIRHRPLPVTPSPVIKPVLASIRTPVGSKLGTVLATSA